MSTSYDWSKATLDEQSAPLNVQDYNWENATVDEQTQDLDTSNIDWGNASIDEQTVDLGASQPQPTQPLIPSDYQASIQTSFEGYGEDGRPDYTHPSWNGYNPNTATPEQKDAVINRISKDLSFQRDEANKAAYEDWRKAKDFAEPVQPLDTYQSKYGSYTEADQQRRVDDARASGEQAVANRAAEIKEAYPQLSVDEAIAQARKDVQADAVDFAVASSLGAGGSAIGAGSSLLRRALLQGAVNAGAEGAGQVAGNIVRGDDVVNDVLSRAGMGAAFGAGAEVVPHILSTPLRQYKEGAEKLANVKQVIEDSDIARRKDDILTDISSGGRSVDDIAERFGKNGRYRSDAVNSLADDFDKAGRSDIARDLRQLANGEVENVSATVTRLKDVADSGVMDTIKLANKEQSSTALSSVDARKLLSQILNKDVVDPTSSGIGRLASDIGSFGVTEGLRKTYANSVIKKETAKLADDIDALLARQTEIASKTPTASVDTPITAYEQMPNGDVVAIEDVMKADQAMIKGARKTVEDLTGISAKLRSGKPLSDSDYNKLIASQVGIDKSGKGDEVVRALMLRDVGKGVDSSTATDIVQGVLGDTGINTAKALAKRGAGIMTSLPISAALVGGGELLNIAEEVVKKTTGKNVSKKLKSDISKKAADIRASAKDTGESIKDLQVDSAIIRDLVEPKRDDDPVITITAEDVKSQGTSDLAKLVGMWNDGKLSVEEAKKIYEGLSPADKKIADELNTRR